LHVNECTYNLHLSIKPTSRLSEVNVTGSWTLTEEGLCLSPSVDILMWQLLRAVIYYGLDYGSYAWA